MTPYAIILASLRATGLLADLVGLVSRQGRRRILREVQRRCAGSAADEIRSYGSFVEQMLLFDERADWSRVQPVLHALAETQPVHRVGFLIGGWVYLYFINERFIDCRAAATFWCALEKAAVPVTLRPGEYSQGCYDACLVRHALDWLAARSFRPARSALARLDFDRNPAYPKLWLPDPPLGSRFGIDPSAWVKLGRRAAIECDTPGSEFE